MSLLFSLTTGDVRLIWTTNPDELDYHHILPMFFAGLQETEDPYQFAAVEGIFELLESGGNKVLSVIPQLIQPIKSNTYFVSYVQLNFAL